MKSSKSCRSIKKKVFLLFISLFFFTSCQDDEPIIEPKFENINIELGANYQGGIIFFIDTSGKHGLIAAKEDQSITDPWWNGNFLLTGAVSLSDGKTNTEKIINRNDARFINVLDFVTEY